jgi:UDP-N-acetylmuramoylalanine--D-glutamate ligase
VRGPWFGYDRFAVWGLGRSGVAAANLLAERGKSVLATDPGKPTRPSSLHDDVEFRAGANLAGDADVVVVSPGLKPSLPVFDQAGDRPVISEIELAWSARDIPLIGITGTDGKTTTTELAAHILSHAGVRTVAAGNIGTPLTEVIDDELDVIVAEVSAFQLWSTEHFDVQLGAFTNVAPDHLDYFDQWEDYVAAKRRMIRKSGGATVAFNWDDPIVQEWGRVHGGPTIAYSTVSEPDVAVVDWWYDAAADAIFVNGERAFDTKAFEANGFYGVHNFANFMAAASLANAHGVALDAIAAAMPSFRIGGHRIEFCGEVGGVSYYDDSKATNAHAAIAGIEALATIRPAGEALVVIAGGVDKGIALDDLSKLLSERARRVILIGEIRERFAESLRSAGFSAFEFAESMEDAVERASSAARSDAAVLLSPACSSFDMFDSYAHRGELFQAAVARQVSSTISNT